MFPIRRYEVTCELPPEKVSAMIGPGGQIVRAVLARFCEVLQQSSTEKSRLESKHVRISQTRL